MRLSLATNAVVAALIGFAVTLPLIFQAGKAIGAICHAPWLLIEAEIVNGRKATSYKSIRTDLSNAGAEVVDETVVVDDNLITSRNPDDLDAFCAAIAETVLEGADA